MGIPLSRSVPDAPATRSQSSRHSLSIPGLDDVSGLVPLVGVYFLVKGLFGVLALITALSDKPNVGGQSTPDGGAGLGVTFGLLTLIAAALTAATLYAGFRILQRDRRGRDLGIVVLLVSLTWGMLSLAHGPSGLTLLLLAASLAALGVLWMGEGYFRR